MSKYNFVLPVYCGSTPALPLASTINILFWTFSIAFWIITVLNGEIGEFVVVHHHHHHQHLVLNIPHCILDNYSSAFDHHHHQFINLYEGGESPSAAVSHHVPVQATQAIQGWLIPQLLKIEKIEWYTDDNSKRNLSVGLKVFHSSNVSHLALSTLENTLNASGAKTNECDVML